MHRTISYISKRVAHIYPGEGRKVLLTFSFFFLVITAYYIVKPVSRSLILDELGSRMVPYADLICVVFMGPVVTCFARLVDYMPKPRLISLAFWTVAGIMVLFWQLITTSQGWVSAAFYVWVAIFSVLIVTLFWLIANDLYRPREAKRLFGFIGSGGILGAIAGSIIAREGTHLIGTKNLVLLSAVLLIVCWGLVQRLWAFVPEKTLREEETLATPRRDTFLGDPRGFAKIFLQSRYLLLLIALVCINKIVGKFIYYQFNPFIETTFTTLDAKNTFTSTFYGGINVVAFIVQFFLTSWFLRRWGMLVALMVLPLGMLVGSAWLLLAPIFLMAAGTELYGRSLNYSLNNTAKEVLYLPIDRTIRYKVKPFIDMVVFRFGGGLAAVIGIILLDKMGLSARWLGVLTVPMVLAWIVVAVQLRGEYTMRIRTLLQAQALSRREPAPGTASAKSAADSASTLGSLTEVRSPIEKLALAAELVSHNARSADARMLLAELYKHEEFRAGEISFFEVSRLRQVIQDHASPVAMRREAIRMLGRQQDQGTLDYLWGLVIVEQEALLCYEATRELVKTRINNQRLQLPAEQIRRQVVSEVSSHQRIVHVSAVYQRHHRGPVDGKDPVIGMLRVLGEESVEQIFRLLMLMYRPEDIHLIYEQSRTADTHVRADALELLDNLVDSGIRSTLVPIFDEDKFLELVIKPPAIAQEPALAYRVLQEAIWDHNYWLSVTALCAISRLGLTTMRQELERATRHSAVIVAAAAKVALHVGRLASA